MGPQTEACKCRQGRVHKIVVMATAWRDFLSSESLPKAEQKDNRNQYMVPNMSKDGDSIPRTVKQKQNERFSQIHRQHLPQNQAAGSFSVLQNISREGGLLSYLRVVWFCCSCIEKQRESGPKSEGPQQFLADKCKQGSWQGRCAFTAGAHQMGCRLCIQ